MGEFSNDLTDTQLARMLGPTKKKLTAKENKELRFARRSVYAAKKMSRGHVLRPGDLVCLRPNVGMPPTEIPRIIGKYLVRALPARALIKKRDLVKSLRICNPSG